jgi:penicillin-binding protein 2
MIDLNERSKEKKNFFNRLTIVYLFFGILFSFFIYQTFSLQVSSYTDYEIASLENKTREILIQPRRGIIYDRNGTIIVNNKPRYNLILNPSKIEDIDKHISEIENIIDLSEKDIIFVRENFKSKAKLNREIVLKQNLSEEEIAKFESRRFQFKNTLLKKDIQEKIFIQSCFLIQLDM